LTAIASRERRADYNEENERKVTLDCEWSVVGLDLVAGRSVGRSVRRKEGKKEGQLAFDRPRIGRTRLMALRFKREKKTKKINSRNTGR
jgi:hypothetical protein